MSPRNPGFDVARALAVFGMVVVNFKIVMGAETTGPEWLVGVVGALDGRAAATFVVLAGVGVTLLSRSSLKAGEPARLRQDRDTLLKRALFLFVTGLLYTSIWPADILHFYGIYIAAAAFVFAAPSDRLWSLAIGLAVSFVVLFVALDYEKGWDWTTLAYEGLWTPGGMVRHLFFNGFHPAVPWLAFVFIGMLIGRHDLTVPAEQWRVFKWGAGVALWAEGTSRVLVAMATREAPDVDAELIAAVFGTDPMPPLPLYLAAGAGTACALIAAACALTARFEGSLWLRPLVSTGQLALTLYVAHVVVGMGTLEALGRLENQTLATSLLASAVFCAAGVGFAHLWRMRFERGPLEALMRALTGPGTSPR